LNQLEVIDREPCVEVPAFKDIVEQWQQMVYNTALVIVQSEADAEDITQDVFVEVYEKLGGFRGVSKLSTWIYRITVNKALDAEKKKKRRKNGGLLRKIFSIGQEEEPVHFNHPGVLLENKENAAVLFMALKKIPENQRVAFTLQKMEGMAQAEIAEVMNMSIYAVESLLARARGGLKKELKQYYQSQV
jgi:RNA polymerase sigma factor (sigma-70 family)